jgi:ABC-2 type transport system ATP-binding protein
MDAVAGAGLREDLAGVVQREGVTVFLTTHNLPEAEKLCSRVAVIHNGRLLAEGHPDELRARTGSHLVEITGNGFHPNILDLLRSNPQVRSVSSSNGTLTLDVEDISRISPLVRTLVEGGAEVEEIRKGKASLEEVFLGLVEEDTHA